MTAVVDTHVHFWDREQNELRYAWLEPQPSPARDLRGIRAARFGPSDLAAESRLHHVTKVVHMDAAAGTPDPVQETAWLEALGGATGWPTAIVARCDLAAPDAAEQLERHAQSSRFRGVREMRPLLGSADLRRGYGHLAGRGLVFCHTVGLNDWPDALALADAHPDVTFCLDQAGMPQTRDADYFDAWRSMLARMAAPPNVVCKVSSLGMREPGWTSSSRRPWIRACIEAFGVQRCFFGSNWPIERLYSSYGDVVQAFRDAIADLSLTEQTALLAGNAERIFRI